MECDKSLANAIQYIIGFLLGEQNESAMPYISYGYNERAKVVIEPSGFFDDEVFLTVASLPTIPLGVFEGMPILFGTPESYVAEGKLFIKADFIASAFFLMTRYEECIRRDCRDEHGRFLGGESLPCRAGFLRRPLIDEYGAFLRSCLANMGVTLVQPEYGFKHVYLTHDIDQIWTWSNSAEAIRSIVGSILKRRPDVFLPLRAMRSYKEHDPIYTFKLIVQADNAVRHALGNDNCTPLYFVMGCLEKTAYDNGYMSNVERTLDLLDYLSANGGHFGYHVSYSAAHNADLILDEMSRVEAFTGAEMTKSRNHYLDSMEPEDYLTLIQYGIRDDFTMTYADQVGFRLGTSRPVRWICPTTCEVTPLVLHPTTVMECTLDRSAYMGIKDESIAFEIVESQINQVALHNGELVLLWHNTSLAEIVGSYQRNLYQRVLDLVVRLGKHKAVKNG